MVPELRGRLSTGLAVLDADLRDLAILDGPDGPMLYALTGPHGGISAYRLTPDGGVTAAGHAVFGTGMAGAGTGSLLAVAETGQLLLGSGTTGQLTGTTLAADGSPGSLSRTDLPGNGGAVSALAMASLGGGAEAWYVVDAGAGRLRGFTDTGSGPLNTIPGLSGLAVETGNGACLTTVRAGGAQYLLLAAGGDGPAAVTSYRIDPVSGALQQRDVSGAVDGLGMAAPTALETVTAFGSTFVLVGAAGSQSLSVLRLGPDGALTATDHLIDSRETRFGGVNALAVLETGGHVLVAAGGSDDGISLFTLLPDGRLIHTATLIHGPGLGLADITAIEMTRTGDLLQLFVTGEDGTGITRFSADLGTLGIVLRDSDTAGTLLAGTAGDDLILASLTGARDRLEGGAGDDTLVSARGDTDMWGGAGRDLFVITEGSGFHRIFDFQPGLDQLDLTGLPFLRNPGQLRFETRSDGARLFYGPVEIRLVADRPITLTDLWPEGRFSGPDHFPVGLSAPGRPETLTGGHGSDRITGTAQNEEITGGAGADTFVIAPGGGADTITDFDPTEDRLDFSALDAAEQARITSRQQGSDRVITLGDGTSVTLLGLERNAPPQGGLSLGGWLGQGERLWARSETIRDADGLGLFSYQWMRNGAEITGATSASYTLSALDVGADISVRLRYLDRLGSHEVLSATGSGSVVTPRSTPAGSRSIDGTPWRDFLLSGDGADTVSGLGGDDTLFGGGDPDLLLGGDGHDALLGFSGRDTLYGGNGNDTLLGGGWADLLGGGNGDDSLDGEGGNDTIYTARGNDTAQGGAGDDMLGGFYGNDSLMGGDGNDQLWGSYDHDTLLGGAGDDTLGGFLGNDSLSGEGGRDELWGAAGNDTLSGGAEADRLGGGGGNDSLMGDAGADEIFGGPGADTMLGGTGDDTLYGAGSNDRIGGEAGNDLLYPGAGADEIIFSAGRDRVLGFAPGEDRVDLRGLGWATDFATLRATRLAATTDGVLLSDSDGNSLLLEGLSLNQMHADMFLFG